MNDRERQHINTLICAIARGNTVALDDLSSLVSGRMMCVAYAVLHNRVLAEDTVQESFVKIVHNAHRFKNETNGYGWICKIVHNTALNVLRKEKRFLTENSDECFNLSDGSDVAESSAAKVAVEQAMSALTQTEKQAIFQKYFMDLSVRAIAKNLKKSKSAMQRLITCAEEKMKVSLGVESLQVNND